LSQTRIYVPELSGLCLVFAIISRWSNHHFQLLYLSGTPVSAHDGFKFRDMGNVVVAVSCIHDLNAENYPLWGTVFVVLVGDGVDITLYVRGGYF
jgi:hypothetical protein